MSLEALEQTFNYVGRSSYGCQLVLQHATEQSAKLVCREWLPGVKKLKPCPFAVKAEADEDGESWKISVTSVYDHNHPPKTPGTLCGGTFRTRWALPAPALVYDKRTDWSLGQDPLINKFNFESPIELCDAFSAVSWQSYRCCMAIMALSAVAADVRCVGHKDSNGNHLPCTYRLWAVLDWTKRWRVSRSKSYPTHSVVLFQVDEGESTYHKILPRSPHQAQFLPRVNSHLNPCRISPTESQHQRHQQTVPSRGTQGYGRAQSIAGLPSHQNIGLPSPQFPGRPAVVGRHGSLPSHPQQSSILAPTAVHLTKTAKIPAKRKASQSVSTHIGLKKNPPKQPRLSQAPPPVQLTKPIPSLADFVPGPIPPFNPKKTAPVQSFSPSQSNYTFSAGPASEKVMAVWNARPGPLDVDDVRALVAKLSPSLALTENDYGGILFALGVDSISHLATLVLAGDKMTFVASLRHACEGSRKQVEVLTMVGQLESLKMIFRD
ncbi:hypothetical protein T439DRAFT_224090 [Meredithblackwellia eburnea MCA 4105]